MLLHQQNISDRNEENLQDVKDLFNYFIYVVFTNNWTISLTGQGQLLKGISHLIFNTSSTIHYEASN